MAAKKKTVLNEYGDAPKSIDDRPFYSLVLDEDQKNFVNAILNPDNTIVFCNANKLCSSSLIFKPIIVI